MNHLLAGRVDVRTGGASSDHPRRRGSSGLRGVERPVDPREKAAPRAEDGRVRSDFLPLSRPSIGDAEIAAVTSCLRSGWLTSGPRVTEFEGAFAEAVGAAHAVAVSSGTAGLHLA